MSYWNGKGKLPVKHFRPEKEADGFQPGALCGTDCAKLLTGYMPAVTCKRCLAAIEKRWPNRSMAAGPVATVSP